MSRPTIIMRHRQIAPPKAAAAAAPIDSVTSEELSPLLAEAKRDIG